MKSFRTKRFVGAAFIVASVTCNVWILGWLLAADHQISAGWLRLLVFAVQAVGITLGLLLLFGWDSALLQMTGRFMRRFPRTCVVGICIVSLAGVWMAMEVYLYGMEVMAIRSHPRRYEGGYPGDMVVPDPILGIRSKANHCTDSRYIIEEKVIFDVTYCCDALGRRATPVPAEGERTTHGLFLGDSITFGLGVNAEETLPAQIAARLPQVQPYNYGVPGREPGYALALLRNRDLREEVHEEKGFALYTFMDYQVDRSIGAMHIVGSWGGNLLCHEFEGDQIVCRGTFASAYPWRYKLYQLLNKDRVLKFTGFRIPWKRRDQHYRLSAALLQALQKEYLHQFPGNAFFVLLYPSMPNSQAIRPFLDELDVPCLQINEEGLPSWEEGFYPEDYHPNATMQALVAARCATALQQQWTP